MKFFLFLIGMVAAGILGYSLEPQLRYQLTGNEPEVMEKPAPKPSSEPAPVPEPAAQPEVAPEPEPVPEPAEMDTSEAEEEIDLASYPPDQLPEKILLKQDVEISDADSDLKMTVTAGNRVNLIRIEGESVIVSPGAGPFEGIVPIRETDLLEQLAALPKPSEATPEPSVFDEPNEPEMVEPEPEIVEEPEAEPEPMPEPEPEPEGMLGPAPEPTKTLGIVELMQENIKSGAIKEFSFDQVLEWTANDEPEVIDGVTYDTGIASYKANTVFGVKTISAKALIQDGEVVRWVMLKSGLEIK